MNIIVRDLNFYLLKNHSLPEGFEKAMPVDKPLNNKEVMLQDDFWKYKDTLFMYINVCDLLRIHSEKYSIKQVFKTMYNYNLYLRSMLCIYNITKNNVLRQLLVKMKNKSSIIRFLIAQDLECNSYEVALNEIRNGKKSGHWIWYIFPQLRGLGYSYMSDFYGIENTDEARAYINHPILGKRLVEITQAYLDTGKKAYEVFESDDIKVRSCMSLFASVSDNPIFKQVLTFNNWHA